MKIASIVLHGNFTDDMAYQENCLPYYQKKVFNADVVIVAGQYSLETGSNNSIVNPPGEYICNNGIRLVRLKSAHTAIGKKVAYLPSLYDVLEKEKPDYIFAHLIQSVSLKDIVKYKKRHPEVLLYGDSHADYINSAHGWFSKKILHGILWRTILNRAEPYFEKIYGVLPSRVSFLKEMYALSDDKIELLLMGAEDELICAKKSISKKDIREKLSLKPSDFVIITGGKIDKNKNIEVLVEAIRAINSDSVKLIIFGKPNDEMQPYFEKISEDEHIIYVGWINSEKMYQLFNASDLCVFPGTHSVIWEQAVGSGLPGVFRYWDGIDHIDLNGNIEFFHNSSIGEMIDILNEIIDSEDKFLHMKTRAEEIKPLFQYSYIAHKSLCMQ